jgi:hypothetical protein
MSINETWQPWLISIAVWEPKTAYETTGNTSNFALSSEADLGILGPYRPAETLGSSPDLPTLRNV